MEYPNYVYRDFNLPGDYYGEIEIVLLPGNKLHIQVNSLHQNYTLDYIIDCPGGQADVVVKYHENMNLYTVITTILDKLTDDHRYYLYNSKNSTDYIYCFPKFIENNPDLPYIKHNELGGALLAFIPENMKYVDVQKTDYETDKEYITLYGEVNANDLFTYDYPIISREMSKEYYDLTRGYNVRRVKLNPESLEYMIDPEFEERYQEYLATMNDDHTS